MQYTVNNDADRRAMLEAIGLSSVDELFADIPEEVKERFEPLGLPGRSELEVAERLNELASLNFPQGKTVSFLGGGVYDHYIPSVVSYVTSRSEFYTAYTPYQPEVSQGTLAAMFEFQTLICELTGMEVANASLYDGATALAEAVLMADRMVRKHKVAVSSLLYPHYRRVVDTYCWAGDVEIAELPSSDRGTSVLDELPDDLSAVVVQSPNGLGIIEDLEGAKEKLGDALLVVSTNPISLGVLACPGDLGADVVVGEGQPLGLPASYGGPYLGIFASRKRFLRQMPGRLAGRTVDAEGNTGYTMAMQTREQHIRRERATSNICTNSQLCALAATVYLASLGGDGLKELATLVLEKAHYLADSILSLPGYELAFPGPFFNEFTVRLPEDPRTVRSHLQEQGILVDDPAGLCAKDASRCLRFAVTEKRTKRELDLLVGLLEGFS